MNKLSNYSNHTYAILRILSGLLIFFHGLQIVFGVLSTSAKAPFTQIWIGGVIMLVCGLLLAIGLFSRWTAFLLSGTFAVAYIQYHWKFQFGAEFFPAINGGELSFLYCFLFLYMACRGGVIWCVDKQKLPIAI
jgi:putative oxidoreductase